MENFKKKCTVCGINDADPEFGAVQFCRFCATGEGEAPVGFDLETLEDDESSADLELDIDTESEVEEEMVE